MKYEFILVLYCSSRIICCFTLAVIWKYLNKKQPAYQTVYDEMIKQLIWMSIPFLLISDIMDSHILLFSHTIQEAFYFIHLIVSHMWALQILQTMISFYFCVFYSVWLNAIKGKHGAAKEGANPKIYPNLTI